MIPMIIIGRVYILVVVVAVAGVGGIVGTVER